MNTIKIILCMALVTPVSWASEQIVEQLDSGWDQLVHFVPTKYLPVSFGDACVVGIDVAPNGKVVDTCSTTLLSRLVIRLSGDKIKKWVFEPIDGTITRRFYLTAIFDEPHASREPSGPRFAFDPPFTLHQRYNRCTISRMDRVAGAVPVKRCRKHRMAMNVELVPIHYGILVFDYLDDPKFVRWKVVRRARKRKFPNCPTYVNGSCNVDVEELQEVYVCPRCKSNREKWFDEHPWFKDEFY